jgi:beta-galactosidase
MRISDLMAKAGVSLIRVGESVWSAWEPEDGQFELDWLEPVSAPPTAGRSR